MHTPLEFVIQLNLFYFSENIYENCYTSQITKHITKKMPRVGFEAYVEVPRIKVGKGSKSDVNY